MLTAEEASRIWRYDPDTGHFFWLIDLPNGFHVGDKAGGLHGGGYWVLRFKGKSYTAGRVAWLIMTGKWPEKEVDHINCDKSDNKFSNLRLATKAENTRNRRGGYGSSGAKGVHLSISRKNPYEAHITAGGKRIRLGCFPTVEEASAAYAAAAEKFHGDFARY